MNCAIKLLLLFVFYIINIVASLNFNYLNAIIYENTNKSSLFGYTTSLFPGNNNYGRSWLYVGAPKSEGFDKHFNTPGALYKCEMKQKCKMEKLETQRDPTYDPDIHDHNAWIGGSMTMNLKAGKFAICGFKWGYNGPDYNASANTGVCYLSMIKDSFDYKKLTPLTDMDNFVVDTVEDGKINIFPNYMVGEAGFSVHITNSPNNSELVMGAPGLHNWNGGLVKYSHIEKPNFNQPQIIYAGDAMILALRELTGYAITSGYYNSKTVILFAISSPKTAYGFGEVSIFKNNPLENGKIVFQGSQIGEYFGAVLASGDINNDGFDDLIIGAPFYKNDLHDEGRIQICYGGIEFDQIFDDEDITEIFGNDPGGQFGTAISFLGDINFDGFGDIAVGAPYNDNGHGVIFIYCGSRNGLVTKATQVIKAREIYTNLRGFGISISNGADIDKNGILDIAVGSHVSAQVVILRGSPLLGINTTLMTTNGKHISATDTTRIMHCFSFINKNIGTIKLKRILTIDEQFNRVFLKPNYQLIKEMDTKQGDCESFDLITNKNTANLIAPIKITIEYQLIDKQRSYIFKVGKSRINSDNFCKNCPVLLNPYPFESLFYFSLGCNNNVCRSYLTFDISFSHLSENKYFLIGSVNTMQMKIDVKNTKENAYLTEAHIFLPQYVQLDYVPSHCKDPENGKLICMIGNPIKKQAFLTLDLNMRNIRRKTNTSLTFTVILQTLSDNLNPEKIKHFTIQLENVVHLKLSGQAVPPSLTFINDTDFGQVYHIEKLYGSSTAAANLRISIPTHIITNNETHYFVKFNAIRNVASEYEVVCKNETEIPYIKKHTNAVEMQVRKTFPRFVSVFNSIFFPKNVKIKATMEPQQELISKGALSIDCEDTISGIRCTNFTCKLKLLRGRDNAMVQFNLFYDGNIIKKYISNKTNILLTSFARLYNYNHIIDNNKYSIITKFIEENHDDFIPSLLIGCFIGTLTFVIILYLCQKCGFFNRPYRNALLNIKEQEEFLLTGEEENSNEMQDILL